MLCTIAKVKKHHSGCVSDEIHQLVPAHFAVLQILQSVHYTVQPAFSDFDFVRPDLPIREQILRDLYESPGKLGILLQARIYLHNPWYINWIAENGDHGGEDAFNVFSRTPGRIDAAVPAAWLGCRESIGAKLLAAMLTDRVPNECELVVRVFPDLRGSFGGFIVECLVGSQAFDIREVARGAGCEDRIAGSTRMSARTKQHNLLLIPSNTNDGTQKLTA